MVQWQACRTLNPAPFPLNPSSPLPTVLPCGPWGCIKKPLWGKSTPLMLMYHSSIYLETSECGLGTHFVIVMQSYVMCAYLPKYSTCNERKSRVRTKDYVWSCSFLKVALSLSVSLTELMTLKMALGSDNKKDKSRFLWCHCQK